MLNCSIPSRRAFTLIELMVVAILLTILGALVVPRLGGQKGRELQLAADRLTDMLTIFAQREALSAKPLGLWYAADQNSITMVVLDIDPNNPDFPADWRPDRAVPRIQLPNDVIASALVNGDDYGDAGWFVQHTPGVQRPLIDILLIGSERAIQVVLPPAGSAPRQSLADGSAPAFRTVIDLDQAGRHREVW